MLELIIIICFVVSILRLVQFFYQFSTMANRLIEIISRLSLVLLFSGLMITKIIKTDILITLFIFIIALILFSLGLILVTKVSNSRNQKDQFSIFQNSENKIRRENN